MIIVNLIPLILAARLNSSVTPWANGDKAKATYLVQDYAIKTYSAESDSPDEIFTLSTLLSCQYVFKNLYCYFHDVNVKTTFADSEQGIKVHPKLMHEDIWVKKSLGQVGLEAEVSQDGFMISWINVDLEQPGRNLMAALFEPLNLGFNFTSEIPIGFEPRNNFTIDRCRSSYYVTRSSASPKKSMNSPVELFLLAGPDESLDKPMEILRKVEDVKCASKLPLYSPFAVKELRTKPASMNIEMHSLDSFITITRHNYTSFNKNVFSVTNENSNTKYMVEESLSLTLQKIEEVICDEIKSPLDCVMDGLKKYRL